MDENSADIAKTTDRMNRADLLSGAFFVLLGLVIVYLSWTMPRLEIRGVHPATVPGLVPGLLGGFLTISGALLALKGARGARAKPGWGNFFALFVSPQAIRFAVVAGLTLSYSLILVGRMPFWLATGLFVFAFILIFEAWMTDTPKPVAKSAFWAAVQAVVVAAVVTAIFQYGFLVRLP